MSSRPIDEKIVKLTLDNNDFEKQAARSIETFKNVNRSIDSANDIDVSHLSKAIESINDNFSLMGQITSEIFSRIARSVVDLGEKMVRSLVFDQITVGFSKYEQKVSAVQTIMAATGKDIDEVSGYMDSLNWYTDETSYNFADMANNIAKFTSNNIDLAVATKMMKGIANWAAISGQNATTASSAMYNFSQAMGAGAMKLQDWKSIQNANMATTEFKKQCVEAAVAVGTLKKTEDGWVTTTVDGNGKVARLNADLGNFDQTLGACWLNVDAMTKVLSDYGGFSEALEEAANASNLTATQLLELESAFEKSTEEGADATKYQKLLARYAKDSAIPIEELDAAVQNLASSEYDLGRKAFRSAQEAKTFSDAIDATKDASSTVWMNIYEDIFGNYEEAKELWTSLCNSMYDIFVAPMQKIEDKLADWKDLGGRDSLLNSIKNIGTALGNLLRPLGKIFDKYIPELTSEDMVSGTKKFEKFTENLVKWTSDWEGTLSSVKKKLDEFFKDLISKFKKAKSEVGGNGVWTELLPFDGLKTLLATGGAAVLLKQLVDWVTDWIDKLNLFKKSATEAAKESGFFKSLKESFAIFADGMSSMGDGMKSLGKGIQLAALAALVFAVIQLVKQVQVLASLDSKQAAAAVAIIGAIVLEVSFLAKSVKTNSGKLLAMSVYLVALGAALKMIASVIKKLGEIKMVDLTKGLVGLGAVLLEISLFSKLVQNMKSPIGMAISLGILAIGMTIMAEAMKTLGGISWDGIKKGLVSIGMLMLEFINFTNFIDGGHAIRAGATMILVGIALINFAKAMNDLSTISWDGISRGLVALGGVLLETVAFIKLMDGSSAILGAVTMIAIAYAISVMADAFVKLGNMKWDSIKKSLTMVGGALMAMSISIAIISTALGLFVKLAGAGGVLSLGVSLSVVLGALALSIIPIAEGVDMLATSVNKLSKLSLNELMKGIGGLGLILLELAAFAFLAKKSNLTRVGPAMKPLGTGIKSIAESMEIIGKMKSSSIEKGVGAIGGLLLALGAFTKLTDNANILSTSLAMVVMGGAIKLFISCLSGFSGMSVTDLAVSLGALAASLIIVAGAGILAGMAGTGILALAAACISVGAAAMGIAFLIESVAIALKLLAETDYDWAKFFGDILTAIALIIPQAVALFIQLIVDIIQAINDKLPDLVQAVADFIVILCDSIGDNLGPVIDAAVALLIVFCAALVDNVLYIVEAAVILVLAFVDGIAQAIRDYSPLILEVIMSVVEAIIELLVDAIGEILIALLGWIPGAEGKIRKGIKGINKTMADSFNVEETTKKVDAEMDALKTDFSTKLDETKKQVGDWGTKTMAEYTSGLGSGIPGVDSITDQASGTVLKNLEISDITGAEGTDAMNEYISGLSSAEPQSVSAAKSVADAANGELDKPDTYSKGSSLGQGFINGILSKIPAASNAGSQLANAPSNTLTRFLQIHSPSRLFASYGEYTGEGFIQGINGTLGDVENASMAMGQGAINALTRTTDEINSILNDNLNMAPTITPVIDLDELKSFDASSIAGMSLGNIGVGQNGSSGDTTIGQVSVNIEITADGQQSVQDIANTVRMEVQQEIVRQVRKVRFNV